MNYTIQDSFGVFTAVILFPLILIFPGYVTSFFLDLFQFKTRQPLVRLGIAALVSASISPILFFLAYRLGSKTFAHILIWGFALAFGILVGKSRSYQQILQDIKDNAFVRRAILISALWIVLATFFLVDIQFGDRLYYNIDAYDYTTRVSVIDAITRSGVPPANPSYFPGSPQPLTQLYYFWYILCSIVETMGGSLVDARMALMASVIWTGLILGATVALFIRLRSSKTNHKTVWKNAFLGIGLLVVSGLDIFPSLLYVLFPRLLPGRIIEGDIEQWNEQITAWIGAITWTPHHVVAMLACILAWMLIAADRSGSGFRQLGISLVIGLALASSFGLSVWLTGIFLAFWGLWFVIRLLRRENLMALLPMIVPGFFMILLLLPFLIDLLSGPNGQMGSGQFPLALTVRAFYPIEFLAMQFPPLGSTFLYLLVLPLNYFLELGFFLLIGIVWIQNVRGEQTKGNPFWTSEVALFLTTVILVTFMRSTIIANNDFGWRGWLFGQFVLVIWGVDVLQRTNEGSSASMIRVLQSSLPQERVRRLLAVLLTLGVITTLYDAFFLRAWPVLIDTGIAGFPRILTPDNHLGERTLAARQAFEYIDQNLAFDTVVQFDPRFTMDRPAGLYRTRTTAISYHALYGVPASVYEPLIRTIGSLFEQESAEWSFLDQRCQEHHIDILILRDLDPIWSKLDLLKGGRPPLYQNEFFTIFACGAMLTP